MLAEQIMIKDLGEDDVLAVSDAYGEPEWLRDRRLEAFKAFRDLDWPHRRIEEWRYTDPRRFELGRPLQLAAGQAPAREAGVVAAAGELDASVRVVDGAVVEAVVSDEAAARGVIATDLATAAREHGELLKEHLGAAVGPDTKFDALNLAAFTGGAFVYVPPEVELARPIAVTVQAATDGALLPRLLVVADRYAKAAVYVDHSGGATATVVEVVEVVVGEGARLDVVTVQDWGDGIDEIATHCGLVGQHAGYRHLEVSLGGRTVYVRPDVRLDNEGGRAELLGVYFTDDGQHMEHRTLIHHNASHTSSKSVYKGALQGDSRAVWYGNIRIEPHAKATASDETNRNLILTDKARADSIPFLEIKTADVSSCGHHSSIGQLDELQVFYMTSRGIPRQEALRLLVFGFFAEVTDRIQLPGVTETVTAEIERETGMAEREGA